MANETLIKAGQIIFEEIVLISADGKNKIQPDVMAVEIDLFEDIYSPVMHGSMTIVENFNLILNLPILGEETLILKFKTPTSEAVVNKAFRVFKVSQREFENSKKHIYVLHFISIEAIVDMSSKVQSVFEGTPTECAKKLFKSKFNETPFRFSESNNIIKYVAPTISPFKALSVLANKAFNNENNAMPDFLFYEDNKQFNFVSLNELYKLKPKYTFRFSSSQMRDKQDDGESTRDINAEFQNVILIDFATVTDTLQRKMSGSYGHKVWEVDMLHKIFKKHTYDAQQDFAKGNHLNKMKPFSQYETTSPEAVVEYQFTHAYTHPNIKVDRDAEVLCKRPVALAQTNWIGVNITVHGNTDIKCGDTVNFELPLGETSDESDKYKSENLDPYYSGTYIIAAIQHRMTIGKHEMVMEIVKDSFKEEVDFKKAGK